MWEVIVCNEQNITFTRNFYNYNEYKKFKKKIEKSKHLDIISDFKMC